MKVKSNPKTMRWLQENQLFMYATVVFISTSIILGIFSNILLILPILFLKFNNPSFVLMSLLAANIAVSPVFGLSSSIAYSIFILFNLICKCARICSAIIFKFASAAIASVALFFINSFCKLIFDFSLVALTGNLLPVIMLLGALYLANELFVSPAAAELYDDCLGSHCFGNYYNQNADLERYSYDDNQFEDTARRVPIGLDFSSVARVC